MEQDKSVVTYARLVHICKRPMKQLEFIIIIIQGAKLFHFSKKLSKNARFGSLRIFSNRQDGQQVDGCFPFHGFKVMERRLQRSVGFSELNPESSKSVDRHLNRHNYCLCPMHCNESLATAKKLYWYYMALAGPWEENLSRGILCKIEGGCLCQTGLVMG